MSNNIAKRVIEVPINLSILDFKAAILETSKNEKSIL